MKGQSANCNTGLPDNLPAYRCPLPFLCESRGTETRFINLIDPEPGPSLWTARRPGRRGGIVLFPDGPGQRRRGDHVGGHGGRCGYGGVLGSFGRPVGTLLARSLGAVTFSSLQGHPPRVPQFLCLLETAEAGLGRKRQGQRRPGAGGEGVSRHHHQGAVAERREASELPCTQVEPPPKSRKLLPAQRPRQVQDVQHAAHRPVPPERQVLLLRLSVEHQARQEVS